MRKLSLRILCLILALACVVSVSPVSYAWGMGGENLDYGDQDFSKITDLK